MESSGIDSSLDRLVAVGIAASAGGLEAASLLVQNLPTDTQAFFVLAQHMSPSHKSILSVLLARKSTIDVQEIGEDVVPVVNTLYVPPPNTDAVFSNGKICLRAPSSKPSTPRPSADRLFKSLAEGFGDFSVGIVLSGTGSDGTYGIKSIREVGGVTIAQKTSTAKYSGMPSSAIETGCVDLVMTPEEIGQNLTKIMAHPRDLSHLFPASDGTNGLDDLFHILHAHTGVNFQEYKESTISRRIARRLVANNITQYRDYVNICRKSITEVEALGQDLLISVTKFFRDKKQFDQLTEAIRELIAKKPQDRLRVWVAGCATGEEAYSIAMIFADVLGGPHYLTKDRIQIFASDVDDRALEVARKGVYPGAASRDIPEKFLDDYMITTDDHIEVRPELRKVVLFSHHNLAVDPPFISVDLVSLRNVLIYFDLPLQEKVFTRVEYALEPNGLLFLGTSEKTPGANKNFVPVPGAERIYTKSSYVGRRQSLANLNALTTDSMHMSRVPQVYQSSRPSSKRTEFRYEALAKAVAPNGFLASGNHEILRVFGQISDILELTEHSTSGLNIRILRVSMRNEAASMIATALKANESRAGHWHWFDKAKNVEFRLVCYPISDENLDEDTVLFAVQSRERLVPTTTEDDTTDVEKLKNLRGIEMQMEELQDTLNQKIEELQNAYIEMQSIAEEFQSTNEELQATNEEFETSNEELQSTNEELITVNDEMYSNTTELQKVSTELSSVLMQSPYPLIIVDQALLVRRASQVAMEFFNISSLPTTGLHITQCAMPPGFPSLTEICADVMDTGQPHRQQVDIGTNGYSLFVTPFFDPDGLILGMNVSIVSVLEKDMPDLYRPTAATSNSDNEPK